MCGQEPITRCIFVWDIENLCVLETVQVIESPTFPFANCSWYLTLFVLPETDANGRVYMQVFLCRRERTEDTFRGAIKMRFSFVQKIHFEASFSPFFHTVVDTKVCRCSFEEDVSEAFSFTALIDSEQSILGIVCDMIAARDDVCDHSHLTESKRALLWDLNQLLNRLIPGNGYLLTDENHYLPVQKEILCASSDVFCKKFQSNVSSVAVDINESIASMMLRYVYSGCIRRVMENGYPPPLKLYRFAEEYEISGLKQPTTIKAKTAVHSKIESVNVSFPNFFRSLYSSRRQNAKKNRICNMQREFSVLEEMVQVMLKYHYDEARGKVIFEVRLWRYSEHNLSPVSVNLLFLDKYRCATLQVRLDFSNFTNQKAIKYRFEVKVKQLFSCQILPLPDDVLTIECRFCFRVPKKFISSLYLFEHPVAPLAIEQKMASLLTSQMFADVSVIANDGSELLVHRSVMSVRSPKFRELLRGTDSLSLDMSKRVAKALISYIYTGDWRTLGDYKFHSFHTLYRAAEEFSISGLRNACIEAMRSSPMNQNNVLEKYSFANMIMDYEWIELCRNFILENKDILLGTKKWEAFRRNYSDLANRILRTINQNLRAF